jgi:pSer/pThr/pTyr-binding forkhead associated (FHA) protein
MPKLIVNPGTLQAREFELKPGAYLVGRGPGNDIRIEEASVSTNHAQIVVETGGIFIKDAGSTNGTFVNGARVRHGELRPGQPLRLGWVDLALSVEPPVTTMVAGIPVPNEIAAEALEAAIRRKSGQKPGA